MVDVPSVITLCIVTKQEVKMKLGLCDSRDISDFDFPRYSGKLERAAEVVSIVRTLVR